jgi:hypothetical protein
VYRLLYPRVILREGAADFGIPQVAPKARSLVWIGYFNIKRDKREETMGLAQYSIVPVRDQWGVLHDGNVNGEYATKEAAFESAMAAASLALREGHEVHVGVPGREEGEAALTKHAT